MDAVITWVMPVYNGQKYIKQAIESILNQPCKYLKLIVVDDGSSDDTPSILKKIKDERMTVLNQNHGGVSCARNLGIDHCSTPYIAFLDADDVLCYGVFNDDIYDILTDGNYDVVEFDYYIANSKLTRVSRFSYSQEYVNTRLEWDKHHCSALYRLDFLNNADLYNKKTIRYPDNIGRQEDVVFKFLINCKSPQKIYISKPLFLYRNNLGSITHQKNLNYSLEESRAWNWAKGQVHEQNHIDICDRNIIITVANYINDACTYGVINKIIISNINLKYSQRHNNNGEKPQ